MANTDGPFFELRQYAVLPGKMDEMVRLMDQVFLPFQTRQGMDIRGTFYSEVESNLFVWIRRFENEEEYQRLCSNTYETEWWEREVRSRQHELLDLDKKVVIRLIPTAASKIR